MSACRVSPDRSTAADMRLLLPVPSGFSLRDSVCSYGFYMLASNRWVEVGHYFTRPLHVPNDAAATRFAKLLQEGASDEKLLASLIRLAVHEIGSVQAEIHQEEGSDVLRIEVKPPHDQQGGGVSGGLASSPVLEALIKAQVRRMLRLSERELRAQRAFARQYCAATCGGGGGGRADDDDVQAALTAELEEEEEDHNNELAASEPADQASSRRSAASPSLCPQCGPRAANRGRIFRSPTCWEDALRTITLCNMSWPGTRRMNWQLCQAFGGQLPLPSQLAHWDAAQLQQTCGVGYRADRMLALARAFLLTDPPAPAPRQLATSDKQQLPRTPAKRRRASPSSCSPAAACGAVEVAAVSIDPEWLESPLRTEAEVYEACLRWRGFGPYAASTLCQLLGHYGSIPADTETVRHLSEVHGIDTRASGSGAASSKKRQAGGGNGSPDRAKLSRALERLYGGYGRVRFLAYWTELWEAYVSKVGVQHMAQLAEERYGDFTATTMARLATAANHSSNKRQQKPRQQGGGQEEGQGSSNSRRGRGKKRSRDEQQQEKEGAAGGTD